MVGLSKIHFVTLLLIFLGSNVNSDTYDHRYDIGEIVPVYANKIGPYSPHWERYNYYDFPFCSPDSIEEKDNLGKMLTGESLVTTPFIIGFRVDKELELLCRKRLNKSDVFLFRNMIKNNCQMQLYYDDLPIRGLVGRVARNFTDENKSKYFLYKHSNFEISYNKDRVIRVVLKYDLHSEVVDVTNGMELDVDFTYSIKWWETEHAFDERLDSYITSFILPYHTHAHIRSIANSCFTIFVVIVCLVIFYTRFLRKNISRYACDVEEAEVNNNQGQQECENIRGDVLRFPKHKSLFSAALGCGTQLLVLMVIILIMGVMDVFKSNFQVVSFKALVIVYAITSLLSGYTSASFYHQLKGTSWIKNLLLTGGLYFGPFFLTFSLSIILDIYNGETATFPLDTIITLSLVWIFLIFPLLVLGGIIGKNYAYYFRVPCRTTATCPKNVTQLFWYRGILPQMIVAGFLPFSVIRIQIYDNLFTLMGRGIYTFYNSMAIMFVLVLIMTSLVSVMLTSFHLAVEDHEWLWRSFFNGGSTGLYVYGYGICYYFYVSDMDTFVQAFCFFGYVACLGYAMFLALGTVGFHVSVLFVRYLYTSIKCD